MTRRSSKLSAIPAALLLITLGTGTVGLSQEPIREEEDPDRRTTDAISIEERVFLQVIDPEALEPVEIYDQITIGVDDSQVSVTPSVTIYDRVTVKVSDSPAPIAPSVSIYDKVTVKVGDAPRVVPAVTIYDQITVQVSDSESIDSDR